jgi:hypothetical protein
MSWSCCGLLRAWLDRYFAQHRGLEHSPTTAPGNDSVRIVTIDHSGRHFEGFFGCHHSLANRAESERNCATARPIESASFRESS